MSNYTSLIDVLEKHVGDQPHMPALRFLAEDGRTGPQLTFADLRNGAFAVAGDLRRRGARQGDRALLIFPAGLDFVVGLFGCLAAGVIAVPLAPPRRLAARDAFANIVADCSPRFGLTTPAYAPQLAARGAGSLGAWDLDWLHVASDQLKPEADARLPSRPTEDAVAFLQYTSGSTSTPKGVTVRHENLLANLEMIRQALGHSRSSTHVCWMPLHHDMGLILNVLEAFYVGATCGLMAPVSFLQRPLSWLRAIHDLKAEAAGGPNFGFELCVSKFRPEAMNGVDLSGWRVAFNGAEPVRAQTLREFSETFGPYGFRSAAFYPCYGMAEATLLISGGMFGRGGVVRSVDRAAMQADRIESPATNKDAVAVVGCGRALVGEDIAIVEPTRRLRLPVNTVGEIWVRGPHVAEGYWGNDAATLETFAASIEGEPKGAWLRTGDLGFLDTDGELFVTGRIKDIIIVRGANHYPQDIEHTVQAASPCLRAGFGAAFAFVNSRGEEAIGIVQEVERSYRRNLDIDDIIGRIREAVADEHGLSVNDIVLVQPGTIPITTSGKIQRRLTRTRWLNGELSRIGDSARDRDSAPDLPQP